MLEDKRSADAEIAAIFTRLKDEVRSTATPSMRATGGGRRAPLPARSQAERAWAVTAERPFEHPPTRRGRVRGWVVSPIKRILRKLMRWYVEPVAAHQRTFNLAVLTLVDELAERTEADVKRLEERLEALEQRLADQAESRG
jgi:hypothetical protein